jgi:hypothetical protein
MPCPRAGTAFAAYNEARPIQLNFEDFVSGLSAYPKMWFHPGKPAQKVAQTDLPFANLH